MKKLVIGMIFNFVLMSVFAQGFNNEKTELSFFVQRMYKTAPFEGVKIMKDYDHEYILSVVVLPIASYNTEQEMNRVAMVKAMRQVNTFFNGSSITSDLVITTSENMIDSTNVVLITETIREQSIGYVQQLELLTNFEDSQGKNKVFVFYKELQKNL